MAITMKMEFPATVEQYDAVNAKLDVANNPPDGLIIHTGAQVGDNIRVIDVWESADHFNRFNEETLMAAVTEVMGEPPPGSPPPPGPEITELHTVIKA